MLYKSIDEKLAISSFNPKMSLSEIVTIFKVKK